MSVLSATAREEIKWRGMLIDDRRIRVSIAGYVRRHFGPNAAWGGDSCGCSDDRCIGYHHDESEDCGCIGALLDQWVTDQRAELEAGPVWTAYRAAVESGDQVALEAARSAAAEWVRRYHPVAPSFSLDVLVDGRAGISITSRFNDLDHLVWRAPEMPATLAGRS